MGEAKSGPELERFSQRRSDTIAAVPDVVGALLWREQREGGGDQIANLVKGPGTRGAQEGFQLRERQLDRVEVGTIGWKEADPPAGRFDGGTHLRLVMDLEVVEHDHVAPAQRRHEDLVDVGAKGQIVDRAIEHGRGLDALHP